MRLRNWFSSWVATCVLLASCNARTDVPAARAPDNRPASGPGNPIQRSDEVEARLVAIIAQLMKLKPETVTREKRFEKDLGLDSLDFVELILEAEDQFKISIPDGDAMKLATVGKFVDYLKSHPKKSE